MQHFSMIWVALLFWVSGLHAQQGYQKPPKAIADLVEAPLTPSVSLNNSKTTLLLLEQPGYPSISEVSQPELRLAGLRINPVTNGQSRGYTYDGLVLKDMETLEEVRVTGLPEEPAIANVSWSPDGTRFAFTIRKPDGLELWMAEVETAEASRLTGPILNDAMQGNPYAWFSDSENLIYKATLPDRGEAPSREITPTGPIVQESSGQKAAVRTYQDMLQSPQDEAVFTYYTHAQLYMLNLASGEKEAFAEDGIISDMEPSPDGNYVMITYIKKPFSYAVPYYRFPQDVVIYDRAGNKVRTIANLPLDEVRPQGFDAVQTGPRYFNWRADKPAMLYWVEAQDEGDPQKEVDVRDKVFYLEAPFGKEKQEGVGLAMRYRGISWGNDGLAVVYEGLWSNRMLVTSTFEPGKPETKKEIFSRSTEDRYADPGSFETRANQYGRNVLLIGGQNETLYLTGRGASPEGDRPFVREYDLASGETSEWWRSQAPYYELPIEILDVETKSMLTRRESTTENPNYFLRNLEKDQITAVTKFPNPYPVLEGIEKEVIYFKREDGVDMTGDLYLPKDYQRSDGPLPSIVWAYPREYKDAKAAGQVSGSPHEFIRLSWASPLYHVTQGYAVFNNVSMPVVGEGEEEPNDNFREQLVMNGRAAVGKLAELGVGDPDRVAIGGHSYGAFMTANLLAHSDIFAAGIARSGAYNRTLTPFGFQREERTYWDAPEVYYTMSPFMHADKIDEPLLMIHGRADNNSGTFPLQSERLFAAIKGLGGTAKLVMLPAESHGYRAKESILHMLYEQHQYLEKYVKNRKVNAKPSQP